ncbi:MAG: hypothetical protein A3I04_05685 [Nitrospinae bacterium RIFCSPLOWO2_02_FULL_39_110]|nr:MAG: hypothetical protein A3D97_03965 [Nitrospinae bacterium RIFCSPHIGHO2_12_FULL_39_42]OGV99863.1 MAG: hypothetical protein A3D20_05390 [Nitrospinae bacterium RIFCSPHIGHO2_02_FULL_39_82]OGW02895.1 MAG: hypothetical protein A2Z59_03405 [Nitrospinae bacterium RIFCSPLOWO2_02_39_17]OGW05872.1 MAG: hypothetical protein A3I04_05685 [Nitrospinae bacterium RIFCSPLOWO2_02_FULL_39_110]OGW11370.1 MAG: hypothetical protein A2W75_09360 [Nitrospinae bacterium RIFCSPLOWO2_12_39_15]OGW11416.1 MAG: hypothe
MAATVVATGRTARNTAGARTASVNTRQTPTRASRRIRAKTIPPNTKSKSSPAGVRKGKEEGKVPMKG